MNMMLTRVGAFLVGSMIAGCVYAENGSSSRAATIPMPAPTFPSSQPTKGDPNGDSADIVVHLAVVRLHLRAVRYTTAAPAPSVIAFYQKALRKLGRVTTKSGGPQSDMQGFRWVQGPGQTTVAAGHTFVAIAPKGATTQYAIMDVDAQPSTSSPAP